MRANPIPIRGGCKGEEWNVVDELVVTLGCCHASDLDSVVFRIGAGGGVREGGRAVCSVPVLVRRYGHYLGGAPVGRGEGQFGRGRDQVLVRSPRRGSPRRTPPRPARILSTIV